MIRVEIEQYRTDSGWECEVWYHHAQDGEYAPFVNSVVVCGEWPLAVAQAIDSCGDEISSLTVEYRSDR
jgi:hypothetical protein